MRKIRSDITGEYKNSTVFVVTSSEPLTRAVNAQIQVRGVVVALATIGGNKKIKFRVNLPGDLFCVCHSVIFTWP